MQSIVCGWLALLVLGTATAFPYGVGQQGDGGFGQQNEGGFGQQGEGGFGQQSGGGFGGEGGAEIGVEENREVALKEPGYDQKFNKPSGSFGAGVYRGSLEDDSAEYGKKGSGPPYKYSKDGASGHQDGALRYDAASHVGVQVSPGFGGKRDFNSREDNSAEKGRLSAGHDYESAEVGFGGKFGGQGGAKKEFSGPSEQGGSFPSKGGDSFGQESQGSSYY